MNMLVMVMTLLKGLRALLGIYGSCRYVVPCTEYVEYQFAHESFFTALITSIKRIMSCNPFW